MNKYILLQILIFITMACSSSIEMVDTPSVYQTHGFGFSQAIKTDGFLFFSGQVGWDTHYQLKGNDFENQLDQSFTNIENLLEHTQSSFQQIVLLRFYVKGLNDLKRDLIGEKLKKLYPKDFKPATTLLGIETLAREDLQIEIEVIAKTKK